MLGTLVPKLTSPEYLTLILITGITKWIYHLFIIQTRNLIDPGAGCKKVAKVNFESRNFWLNINNIILSRLVLKKDEIYIGYMIEFSEILLAADTHTKSF